MQKDRWNVCNLGASAILYSSYYLHVHSAYIDFKEKMSNAAYFLLKNQINKKLEIRNCRVGFDLILTSSWLDLEISRLSKPQLLLFNRNWKDCPWGIPITHGWRKPTFFLTFLHPSVNPQNWISYYLKIIGYSILCVNHIHKTQNYAVEDWQYWC